MTSSNVLGFSENIQTMTDADGLAFIARMRRQLDRFEVALPHTNGRRLPHPYEAEIRHICDDLESNIRTRSGHT